MNAQRLTRAVFFLPLVILVGCASPEIASATQDPDRIYGSEREAVESHVQLSPDQSDGSFNFEYPLMLPPGRNGVAPQLSLQYSSKNTEQISPFGYGWTISIPYVERLNRYGTNKMYVSPVFFSSIDGELVATSSDMGGSGNAFETEESTSTEETSTTIRSMLEGKSAEERANIKAEAIFNNDLYGAYADEAHGLEIEIVDYDLIDGGIQVFAKAWKDEEQVGFGPDGSVEIERFRIFNPPVLVPDGTMHEVTDESFSEPFTYEVDNYMEDPVEALHQALAHTINLVKKEGTEITPGKIGNTTDTYYPDADPESTSMDGRVGYSPGSAGSWATWHDQSSGSSAPQHETTSTIAGLGTNGATQWENIYRGFFLFNTSPIPNTDTISSATLSLYGSAKNSNCSSMSQSLSIVSSSPASTTALVVGDYDQLGTTTFATDMSYASFTTGAYNDFALNSSGLAAISSTSTTKLGTRFSGDRTNTEPTRGCNDDYVQIIAAMADTGGTTSDPKLVIVHTGSGIPDPLGTYEYGALVENGSFNEYNYENDTLWRMFDKSGTMFTFGSTTNSQIYNSATSSQTFRWLLDEVRDRNDNYVEYEYYKDGDQAYPYKVRYTGNGSTDGVYEVEFLRESRSDTATSSAAGFPVYSRYRIKEIDVKVNGVITKKYILGYGTGDNGVRSMLTSITETAFDDSNASTTLPATNFKYSTSTPNWTLNSSWNAPLPIVDNTIDDGDIDMGLRFDDFNGDGFPDIVQGRDSDKAIYINNRNGTWSTTTPSFIPAFSTTGGEDSGYRSVDVDGDGLPDFLGSDTYGYINVSRAASFATNTDWAAPLSFNHTTELYDMGVRLADVNGDGLPDILKSYYTGSANSGVGVYLNNGAGWDATSTNAWAVPATFTGTYVDVNTYEGIDYGARLADFNGDGLTDAMVGRGSNSMALYLNDGDGTWTEIFPTGLSHVFVELNGSDNYLLPADANGDGLTDLVYAISGGSTVYINKGEGKAFEEMGWDQLPVAFKCSHGCTGGVDLGARLVDVNADGKLDIVKYYAGTSNSTSTNGIWMGNGKVPDLLIAVGSSRGATTTIAYSSSASSTNPLMPMVLQTVTAIGQDDGFGTIGTTTYSYGGGKYYYSTEYDRKFAGFATTTVTDPAGNVSKIYFHQGDNSQTGIGEYDDSKAKIGKAYRTETYDSSGNLYTKRIDKWDSASLSNGRIFVKRAQSVESSYDGDGDHKDKATAFTFNDAIGNLSTKIEYGEVTGSDDGTFSDTGSDTRTTLYAYATSTAYSIFGLPQSETVKNNSGTQVAQKRIYYDGLSLGSVTKGNTTKQESWITGSTYASSTNAYNGYGLVASTTDPLGKVTTYTYESANMYVGTTTNPLGQITETYRDMTNGKAKKMVDANGLPFETVFDGLDRVTAEKIPDHLGTPTNTITKTTYAYTDTKGVRRILKTDYLNAATSTETYTYLDGLDRTIQERKEMEGSDFAARDMRYDVRSNVAEGSLPYTSSGSSRTTMTADPDLLARYAYDPLGRLTSIGDTVGTTTYAYDQWAKTTTDRRGKVKVFTSDSYSNLAQVDEQNATTTYSTVYTYDALGNLTKITDALANVRNFTYDGLSRLLTSEDLHAVGDGTFGTRTYLYDAANLATSTDAKAQSREYTYDDLNRVLTENYTGTAGTEIQYGYDWCTYGKGRMCSATTTDAVTKLAYDALGSAATESRAIDNATYVTTYTRDRLGNQTHLTYPNSREVLYVYNAAGQLENIDTRPSGGSYAVVVEDLDYGPTGQVTYKRFGNNIESTYTYDENELYRLRNITTNVVGMGGTMTDAEIPEEYWNESLIPVIPDPESELDLLESLPQSLGAEEELLLATSTEEAPVATSTEEDTDALELLAESSEDLLVAEEATTTEESVSQPTARERASVKADIVIEYAQLGTYEDEEYGLTIEIQSVEKIEGGIQVYARAWKGEEQLGFLDGSVEIERFRIFNPPTQVPDGTFHEVIEEDYRGARTHQDANYEFSPLAALRKSLAHTINLVGMTGTAIEEGKVGHTTDTFYPDGNTETASVDGLVSRNDQNVAWSAIHDHADGTSVADSETVGTAAEIGAHSVSNWENLRRGFFLFDTSALPDTDTISSATFSLYGSTKSVYISDMSQSLSVVSSNPASSTVLATADYDQLGTTAFATDIPYSSFSTSSYNDFTLNSSGLAAINPASITKLGTRFSGDRTNTEPTRGGADDYVQIRVVMADTGGTTSDPKLVVVHSAPVDPGAPASAIQYLTYTYDEEGNITTLTDYSTSTGKIVTYAYDDLNRLTSASTTAASSSPYLQTYAYNAIGDITNKSDIGAYLYAGTGYANPHAATAINGVARGYDENGNATSSGAYRYAWDYRDRLTQVATGTATTTYGYDQSNENVWKKVGTSATTTYPNQYFETQGATSTSYIYLSDGSLVGMITSGPSATSTYFVHGDRLGDVGVLTNASGTVTSAKDFYPFGSIHINSGTETSDKGYIGERYDSSALLQYLHARFYDPARGQFTSIDPVFLSDPSGMNITDPQSLNAYAYALNNPITNFDKTGESAATDAKDFSSGFSSLYYGIKSPGADTNSAAYKAGQNYAVELGLIEQIVGLLSIISGGTVSTGGTAVACATTACAASPVTVGVGAELVGSGIGLIVHGQGVLMRARDSADKTGQSQTGGSSKPASPNQLNQKVQRGQAPSSIDRVDKGNPDHGEKDHIEFKDGNALNKDGTWKHGGRPLTNPEKDFIKQNGWSLPKK